MISCRFCAGPTTTIAEDYGDGVILDLILCLVCWKVDDPADWCAYGLFAKREAARR